MLKNSDNTMPPRIQNWLALNEQYPEATLLKLVLASFIKHHTNSSTELRMLLAQQEFAALGKLAHRLKGSASVMHAPLMIDLAEALETEIQATGTAPPGPTENLATQMDQWVAEIISKLETL